MSPHDVHPDDMFDDPALEAFARDLRESAATTPPPVPNAALAAVFRDGLPPAPGAPRPAGRRSPGRRRGLRGVVAGLVAGVGVGGLGVAGALPDPVQRQVVRAAEVIGVELPDPDRDSVEGDETEPPAGPPTTRARPVPPTSAVPSPAPPASTPAVTAPGQVDDDEAPGRGRGRGRGAEEGADRSGAPGATTSTTPTASTASTTPSRPDGANAEDDGEGRGRGRGRGRGDDTDDDAASTQKIPTRP